VGGSLGDGGSPSIAGASVGAAAGEPGAAGDPSSGGAGAGGDAGGRAGGSAEGGVAGVAGEAGGGGEVSGGGESGGATGGVAGVPPSATALALGAFHSCAAFDGGSVRCWGSGGYLGRGDEVTIGDDEPASFAGDVELGGTATQLSAGWYQTCAVIDGGKLRCWGSGLSGLLGYANTETIGDDETPASAGDVNVGGTVTQVSAGASHTCACLTDGTVRCWGSNESGKLGYPGAFLVGDDETPASLGAVDVGGFVVQVAAGRAHTCALLDNGNVRCWGGGGRLGYANDVTIGDDETPASAGDVDVGGSVVQIVAGIFHTCALLETGSVRCWGVGYNGALGYGNEDNIGDDETPASAGDVDVGGTVSQIAGGDWGTCALLTTGAVRCWGSGDNGQLGYESLEVIGDDETPASVGDVNVGGLVSAIDMGFLHACVILETFKIRCWGRGGTAALGYGNLEDIGDDETPASAGDVETH
jgi:alpha-tubulin suppressor-like RCC1 family protein